MSETRVWRIHSRVAFQKVEDGFFVITPDNALHQLNDSVSIRIWETLEGEGAPVDLLVQMITEDSRWAKTWQRTISRSFWREP